MCGIAGWVDWDRDLREELHTLSAMTDSLACRGPDAYGTWISPRAVFGHRRLAVIDIGGGSQPMVSATQRPPTALIYGGEVYNYREIASDLKARGVAFRTNSDTEVVLEGYLHWGIDFVNHLEGMFAIAIWDSLRDELILTRDHVGVKPLFYFAYDHGVIFGSEPKALLANSLVKAEVDREGLAEILGLWPYKTPGHGIYKGVKEVRPGELVRFAASKSTCTRYWTPQVRAHADDVARTAAKVRTLLEAAVTSQLISDVPICALLSGGLDSSSVTALAVRHVAATSVDKLRTFSVDFVRASYSFRATAFRPDRDAPFVKIAADYLQTQHSEVLLDSKQILNAHSSALAARDLPDTADMDASLLLLFRAISTECKVSISGEGADEVFGGYPWYREHIESPIEGFPWVKYLCFEQSLLTKKAKRELQLSDYVGDRFLDATREVPPLSCESPQDHRMRVMTHLDLFRFLPGQLERKDRMSMASGVEARVPFCDRRLVEYAYNIPWTIKITGGIEKGILREAVAGLIPNTIATRRKTSYPTTFDREYEAALEARVRHVIDKKGSAILDFVDRVRVRELLEGRGERPTARPSVWMGRLVSLDEWLDRYGIRLAI
jgi:asparagine synthase (glutamine-hydrolysing)